MCTVPADLSLAAFHDDELLLWRGPGKHDLCVVLQDVIQLLRGHVLQVTAMHDAGLGVSAIRVTDVEGHPSRHHRRVGGSKGTAAFPCHTGCAPCISLAMAHLHVHDLVPSVTGTCVAALSL